MRAVRKIIVFSSLFLLLLAGLLAAAAAYLYTHPEIVATHASKYFSKAAGLDIQADRLHWTLRPLSIEAGGISISSALKPDALEVGIPDLACRMHLDGRFGRRVLVVDYIRASGLSVKIRDTDFGGPGRGGPEGRGAFLRVLVRLAGFFLFRDVFIREIMVEESGMEAQFNKFGVSMAGVTASRGPGGGIEVSGEAKIRVPHIDGTMSVPDVRLSLDPDISLPGEKWRLDGDIQLLVEKAGFSCQTKAGDFSGVVSGKADLSLEAGRFPSVDRAEAVLIEGGFSNGAAEVDLADVEMRFSGRHPGYEIELFSARIPRALLTPAENRFSLKDIHVSGSRATVDVEAGTAEFPEISISSPLAGDFSGRGTMGPKKSSVSLAGKDTELIGLAGELGLMPADWRFSGTDVIRLDAVLTPERTLELSAGAELESISFQDPSGRFMGEGVSAELGFDGVADINNALISGEFSVEAPTGEVLLDLFYLDLGSMPFESGGKVQFLVKERRAGISNYRLAIQGLLDLVADGSAEVGPGGPSGSVSVHLPPASLSSLYDFLVREPFGRQAQALEDLRPGGKISADLEISGRPSELAVTGGIKLTDGRFGVSGRDINAEGVYMDLPVLIQTGHREMQRSRGLERRTGRFLVEELRVPLLAPQRIDFTLEAGPNRIRIPDPSFIYIPGGKIEPGPLSFADFIREGLRAQTSARVVSGDLTPLTSAIWPGERSGSIEGLLDPVVIEKDRILTRGGLDADIFGGVISISGLEVERIFSSAPLLKLSAEFSGIDLGRLTRGTAFGRIEGIMNGYISNLEIAGNQPQRFEMLLETAEDGPQERKISVKAVENISRIGAGGSPFAGFAGILTSFFETLGYKKIGVKASLNNDYFSINGTIRQGGTEYIMKRSGISGVNIVNRNPDNRIRFKDMVNRIRRVLADEK